LSFGWQGGEPDWGIARRLVGAVDLGGASTQIVFPLHPGGLDVVDIRGLRDPQSSGEGHGGGSNGKGGGGGGGGDIVGASSGDRGGHASGRGPKGARPRNVAGFEVSPRDFWGASYLHYGAEFIAERLYLHLLARERPAAAAAPGAGSRWGLSWLFGGGGGGGSRVSGGGAFGRGGGGMVENPCDLAGHVETWLPDGPILGGSRPGNLKGSREQPKAVGFIGTGDAAGCRSNRKELLTQ
jgi:hypothetical protein